MSKKVFGTVNNRQANIYTLKNDYLKVEVSDYGGIIKNLYVKGIDVVLGFDELESYLKDDSYQGALIGRYANRIENGVFSLNDKDYLLSKNENSVTHLHGGNIGFDKQIWDVKEFDGNSLALTLFSADGDEGFPGNLNVTVSYTLSDNKLIINYKAQTDMDTPVNLTNHSYFNLNGFDSGKIYNHFFRVNADEFSMVDDRLIPIKKSKVVNTPFDFRKSKEIIDSIMSDNKQITACGGIDHNFYIDKSKCKLINEKTLFEAASVTANKNKMTVYTDMPCLQLYTGNFLSGKHAFKNRVKPEKHIAFCLETQYAPNSPNNGEAILRAGQVYDKTTAFVFD